MVLRPDGYSSVTVNLSEGEVVKKARGIWLALIFEKPNKKLYGMTFVKVEEGRSILDYIIGRVVWHGQYV